jgi:hypothetical protein
VTGERGSSAELHVMPAFPAGNAHRRELSRAAEDAIRTALALPARVPAPGTRAVVEPDRRQRSAPQATRVQHQDVGRELQFERRPMAADNRHAGGLPVLVLEPRTKARGRQCGPRFSLNSITPSAVQKRIRVHALTIVRNRSNPGARRSTVRLVAVERAQEIVGALAREHRLDFGDSSTAQAPTMPA